MLNILGNLHKKIPVAMALIASSPAFAGGDGNGLLTYTPANVSVPALSGGMMILLAALMAVVGFRVIKQKSGGGTMAAALLGVAVLASGASGIKLIADAYAPPAGAPLELPGGGQVIIEPNTLNLFANTSGRPQQIAGIDVAGVVCGNFPNGGPFEGTPECAIGLVLPLGGVCGIDCFSGEPVCSKGETGTNSRLSAACGL